MTVKSYGGSVYKRKISPFWEQTFTQVINLLSFSTKILPQVDRFSTNGLYCSFNQFFFTLMNHPQRKKKRRTETLWMESTQIHCYKDPKRLAYWASSFLESSIPVQNIWPSVPLTVHLVKVSDVTSVTRKLNTEFNIRQSICYHNAGSYAV